jgi:hypothetical protein
LEEYEFIEGLVPSDYRLDFEEALFNMQAHRNLQTDEVWTSFHILNTRNKSVSASIHFQVNDTIARSPLRSPFGSIEFSRALPENTLFEFIKFFEQKLKSKGVACITIKNYPQVYADDHAILLQTFFINLKYHVTNAEIGSVIKTSTTNIENLFHRSERRKLEKAIRAELVFKEINTKHLSQVYTFIQHCRAEKNYELSMTLSDLQKAAGLFPDNYLLFGVFYSEKMIAASIAIRVKGNILYDFYHDHDSEFDHLSPVVFLVAEMYDFCFRNSIRLLDLGTSAIDGVPNFSLLHFKKYLGCKPTPKLTFEKILD